MAVVVHAKAPGGAENLLLETVELPEPRPDEIRLRQTAIGVNFIDIYQRSGLYPLPDRVPGVEAAGIVTAKGSDVTGLSVGDRVAYAGGPAGAYASERNLPAWRAMPLPDSVSDARAASTLLKGITAAMLLGRTYVVGPGTTLLVHSAAGGLGQVLTRLARLRGATIIGTVSSEAKADLARAAGAHHLIVGRDADFVDAVRRWTAGRGVDVAYDGVGGRTLARTLACVRPFGMVASIGQSAGPIPDIAVEELGPRRSLSLARPSVMAHVNDVADYRRDAEIVLAALANGELGGDGTPYPLAQAVQAHLDLESGRSRGALYLVP
ncbi:MULTISPECIES: quinone oxidoreductase family protein [Bradyrhizobium]|uniref:quinone oxidoreductase family protein n=2 Tax=Nitrobacteraceae TaxID=41294 RepID=UPI0001519BDC|nr:MULTISPECIES: quinone oxidoreductase [Bradyrhizobium]ABQ39219.1 putative quinone oxidoreductase [Bradyrhizobium sp. BTAi1]MCL8487779.1 quinone oxidoreductase [Bradyrhizobium denitrificans]